MKKEKQRERRKRRFNGSLESRTVRGRERERTQKLYSKLFNLHYNLHVCVFNAHFYTSPYKD